MKKMFIIIFIFIIMFIGYDNISAICYRITAPDGKVSYSIHYESWQVGPYKIENAADSKCTKILSNKVSCGSIGNFNKKIPELTSWIFTLIQVAVPIILVIFGSIDFVKAIIASKEDEIKRGQQMFLKRIIVAILIFFIVVIVKMLVSALSSDKNESQGIINCIDCFVNNKCN